MATVLEEVFESPKDDRQTGGDSIFATYHIRSDDLPNDDPITYDDAKAYWIANGATTYDGLPRESYSIEPVDWQLWQVKATFATQGLLSRSPTPARPTTTSTPVVNFSIATETTRVRAAIAKTASAVVSGMTAPDFGTLVNVNESGVEGVDIRVPTMRRSETWLKPASAVTDSFINGLHDLAGTVNSSSFRSRAAGEVLFIGADGSRIEGDQYQITYQFDIRPNETSVTVSPGLTLATLKGWEYAWVYYEPQIDDSAGRVIRDPVAAYAMQVYASSTWTALGIGA
jgi:hypothetical protein